MPTGLIAGLSRGNRVVIRNGMVRRGFTLPVGGSFTVRSSAGGTDKTDVLSSDSTGVLKIGLPTTAGGGFSPTLVPAAGYVSVSRVDLSTQRIVSLGASNFSGVSVQSGGYIGWSNSATDASALLTAGTLNGVLSSESSGVIQLGFDAASVVAQTIKACDGFGTDKAGANFTIAAGRNTGSGTEGNILFQTTSPSVTSASPGALTTRLTVNSVAVTSAVPVKLSSYTVAGVPSAATSGAGAMIWVSNESGGACPAFSDGTNWKKVALGATIS